MSKNKEVNTQRASKKKDSATGQKYIKVSVFSDELQKLGIGGTVDEATTAIRNMLGVDNPLRRKTGSSTSNSALSRMFKDATPEQKAEALRVLNGY
jgi:hypothetical protein